MGIDFSTLKNIDFTNPENIFFLFIISVIAIIVISIFVFLVVKTVKVTKKVAVRLFNIEVKKPILRQKNNADSSFQVQGNRETGVAQKQRIVESSFVGGSSEAENKNEGEDKKSVKFQRGKSEKEIAESLSKLKPADASGDDTLQSKMPSRTEKQEEENFKAIKIPTSKHFPVSVAGGSGTGGDDTGFKAPPKIVERTDRREVAIPKSSDLHTQKLVYEKGKAFEKGKAGVAEKNNHVQGTQEGSIFEGNSEVPRLKLEHEMKINPKIWQAQKQAGLSLSPVERANLVKEVFSEAYGSNISKTDLKGGIKKLNQKMLGSKNPEEHA